MESNHQASPNATITLKAKKDVSIVRRHPWLFSGAIKNIQGDPASGDLVRVVANKGRHLGYGHFSPGNSIAVRMLSFNEEVPDAAWWEEKVSQAVALRKELGLLQGETQNTCRLIHAEGDGLPGLIVDYYDGVIVIQTHSMGMQLAVADIVEGLKNALGSAVKGIYDKSAKVLARNGNKNHEDGWLYGSDLTEGAHSSMEHGASFIIDWEKGQKTGFFIDQRENRKLLSELSRDKVVLNTFSYTGGFSVQALHGGARRVDSLDSSARALEVCDENVALNGFPPEKHRTILADAVEYLKQGLSEYDVVVLDPPAFAKRASARHSAVRGYKHINARAISSMKPGSLLFTFSCSQAVDEKLFTHTVISAAMAAEREAKILYRLHQPPDHPVSAFHPEGAYLKGLVLRID